MGLLDLLGLGKVEERVRSENETASQTIRKISEALDKLDRDRAKYIACFAYVLGRVAHADLDISEEEMREMERIVCEFGGLPEEQAVLVVHIAKTQNILFGSTENYIVTREFADISSYEQKIALLECLFAVSSSDESISTQEDNEIARVSKELGLSHRDLIAARSAYRQHLEVLKKRPEAEQDD